MKNFIYILLALPSIFYGQDSWVHSEQGNAFDGFARMAHVSDIDNDLGLVIVNKNDKIFVEANKASDFSKVFLSLARNSKKNNLLDLSLSEKVLMSFDRDEEVYYIEFYPTPEAIKIRDAISSDLKNYLDIFKIIELIKTKKEIHFRLISGNNHRDYTFTLKNSGNAINNTVRYPPGKNFSEVNGLIVYAQKWSKLHQWKIEDNCFKHLEQKYGANVYELIESIELSADKQELIFDLKFGLGQEIIPREIFIQDVYDENGNFIPDPSEKD